MKMEILYVWKKSTKRAFLLHFIFCIVLTSSIWKAAQFKILEIAGPTVPTNLMPDTKYVI